MYCSEGNDTYSDLGAATQSLCLLTLTCPIVSDLRIHVETSVCYFVATETSKNHGGQGGCFPLLFIVEDVFDLQNITSTQLLMYFK